MFLGTLIAYIIARKTGSLLVAMLGGLIIGGLIIWPAYYESSGLAAKQQLKKRQTLPVSGSSINKYGYSCSYLAVTTANGEKYYYTVERVPSIYDKPQQYYCTEEQAQAAGYKPF